jgi:hypothetical protein
MDRAPSHEDRDLSRALELARAFAQGKPLAKEDLDLAAKILHAIAGVKHTEKDGLLAAIAEAAGKLAAKARDPSAGGPEPSRPPATLRRLNRSREGVAPAGDEPDSI